MLERRRCEQKDFGVKERKKEQKTEIMEEKEYLRCADCPDCEGQKCEVCGAPQNEYNIDCPACLRCRIDHEVIG